MFQDTHIHIQDIKNPSGIEAFLKASGEAGVRRFFNCAITPADWPLVRMIARQDARVVPCFGIHPWFADMTDKGWKEQLADYLAIPGALAGEMGLDRARKNIDLDAQKEVFTAQLDLARRFNKPFCVHCIRAWPEVIALIRAYAPGLRFLVHSFNGSSEIAREILDMGGYLSLSARQLGQMTDAFREVAADLPFDRIFVETDFPYQIRNASPGEYIRAVKEAYTALTRVQDRDPEQMLSQVFLNGNGFLLDSSSGEL